MRSVTGACCFLFLAAPLSFGQIEMTSGDNPLLDEISYASFTYFWNQADPQSGLVKDRSSTNVCSVAALGFGFAALPIGVERGYVSLDLAKVRARKAIESLQGSNAQHNGIFCHFIDIHTGNTTTLGYESCASTVDTALLAAGMLVAGEYFGGDIQKNVKDIFRRMNWASFVNPTNGQVYMAWQPDNPQNMSDSGKFEKQTWDWYSDETLLISLLGQAAPEEQYRLRPESLINWKRPVGNYKNSQPFIYSYPGTLFTYMFAHCFYDFRRTGLDPLGVDWFENTRRAVIANRDWCRDNSTKFTSYDTNRWGITAGSGPGGKYVVLGNPPCGQESYVQSQNQGTLHPYGAAMSLPFLPGDAINALKEMRMLKVDGKPIWQPLQQGGYGFYDGFNIEKKWVSGEVIGIAQGPMLLMIENARTGLIWKLMMKNEEIKAGLARAGFKGSFEKN